MRNLSQSGSNKQGEEQKVKGIFRPKSEIQAVFTAKNRCSPKKKVFIQKRCQSTKTLIWTSICTPEAPSLLISSGHNPRLGGAQAVS